MRGNSVCVQCIHEVDGRTHRQEKCDNYPNLTSWLCYVLLHFECFLTKWLTRNIHGIAHYSMPPFMYNLLICHKDTIETTHPSQLGMLLRLRHSFSIECLSDI